MKLRTTGECEILPFWRFMAAALLCLAPSTALSQEGVFNLGTVEVVGTGDETPSAALTEQVSSEEMRQFNREDVAEALDLLPGVHLSRIGARNESAVYVRGFDIRRVPLFLDGIPIYVPYDGYPDLRRFTTFDLSQIVLSKGFASVLYGPNTMGGAINLVSKRPEKAFEGNMGAGIASGDSYQAYLNLGTNQDWWYLQAGGSWYELDYFRLSDNFDETVAEDGGRRENSYQEDYKYNVKIGLTPRGDDEYAFSYIKQRGKKGTPPYAGDDPSERIRYWRWPYWEKESFYFNTRTRIAEKSYVKSRLYYDNYENSLYSYDDADYDTITRPYAFRSDYDDHTYGGSVEAGTELIPRNYLKLAFHYKRDVHKEHNLPNPYQRFEDEIFSIGVENTVTFTPKLKMVVGLSYDSLETLDAENLIGGELVDFENKEKIDSWNPQIGFFYDLTETATVYATAAHKTRQATIKDKYSYRLGRAIPNPDLDPEKAINYQLGYRDLFWGRIALDTAVFYSHIKDFIQLATITNPADPTTTIEQNQNIGKVDQYGFEIGLSGEVFDFLTAGINYTFLERDNRSNDDELTNTPNHKLFTFLRYHPLTWLTLQTDLTYYSKSYSSSNGVRVAEEFAVVNAKAEVEPLQNLIVEAGINNLFDADYAYDEGYPEPGINFFTNIRYRF
ncbi:MAG: TonB-dependent receptor [Syntrophotaleaceae bacterium]